MEIPNIVPDIKETLLNLPVSQGIHRENYMLILLMTQNLVKYGPEAYAKVEIVLLNGDFDPSRDWTADHFNIQIVGQGSIMLGKNLHLNLQEGVGRVGEIKLKHRAQWMKKSKFRLGARMVHLPDSTIEVREAVTGLFLVKDKRLKSNKRDPPSPSDEVWRLKRIGKDGPFHKKLFENDIRTVGDFLTGFSKDVAGLRGILGPTMSDYMWNVTLTHAQRCKWGDTQLFYCPSKTCQEIAMVNRLDSFTDMSKNQHELGFPRYHLTMELATVNLVTSLPSCVNLDFLMQRLTLAILYAEDPLQKLMENLTNSDDGNPEQLPYVYNQKSTPNNLLLLTCLKDEEIPEFINELLLDEEPGKSCIMHSDEYQGSKYQLIKSRGEETLPGSSGHS